MTPPAIQAAQSLEREFADHLTTDDRQFIVLLILDALREPTQTTLQLFEEELDEAWGQHSDPSADEADKQVQQALARRLALTYAWRRSIDRLRRDP